MTRREALQMITTSQAAMRQARITNRLGAYRAALANFRLGQNALAKHAEATTSPHLTKLAHARAQMQ